MMESTDEYCFFIDKKLSLLPMKKCLFILPLLLFLPFCRSKKEIREIEARTATDEQVLAVAQKRWAGTLQSELEEGKKIYTGPCTKCHELMLITKRSEKKWLHEIDEMAPKAKLTPEEKLKLTKYILSYREATEPAPAAK
jgi:hypothetical protein